MAKNGRFLVIMEAEDSAEGLVKVVYQASWKGRNMLLS